MHLFTWQPLKLPPLPAVFRYHKPDFLSSSYSIGGESKAEYLGILLTFTSNLVIPRVKDSLELFLLAQSHTANKAVFAVPGIDLLKDLSTHHNGKLCYWLPEELSK